MSWYWWGYKGNFHGQGDIRPNLGNWRFLVSSAAILAQLANPNFSPVELATLALTNAKNPANWGRYLESVTNQP